MFFFLINVVKKPIYTHPPSPGARLGSSAATSARSTHAPVLLSRSKNLGSNVKPGAARAARSSASTRSLARRAASQAGAGFARIASVTARHVARDPLGSIAVSKSNATSNATFEASRFAAKTASYTTKGGTFGDASVAVAVTRPSTRPQSE
jgi:hypothetical protein